MHEAAVVGDGHVGGVDCPRHVARDDFAVVGRAGDAGAAPVFGVDEVGALKGFHLVVLDARSAGEGWVKLVALGMGYDEVYVGGVHPLRERVGHGLRQGAAVGRPREHHLRARLCLVLLYGDEVGEGLQGVHGGRFHGEDGASAVTYELVEHGFGVVVFAVGQAGERAHADDVAIAAHHGYGLEQVLALVAVHDDAALGLELPGAGVHVEHDDVHAEVHGGLLRAEARAQAVVEEYHEQRLVLAQLLVLKAVALNLLRLGKGLTEAAEVANVDECFHFIS